MQSQTSINEVLFVKCAGIYAVDGDFNIFRHFWTKQF